MSEQTKPIQAQVEIRKGKSTDLTSYIASIEEIHNLTGDGSGPDGIQVKVGDMIEWKGEKLKVERIWISFLNETIRKDAYTSPDMDITEGGYPHPFNCRIVFETNEV